MKCKLLYSKTRIYSDSKYKIFAKSRNKHVPKISFNKVYCHANGVQKHVFVLEMGQKPYVYIFNNYYNITKVNRAL